MAPYQLEYLCKQVSQEEKLKVKGHMAGSHCFISYSTADGIDFAIRLHDALESGPPPIQSWVDKRDLRPGEDWEKQIVSAIQSCFAFVFVMTTDSVAYESVCRAEWSRALKYRKPIIPLLFDENVEPPLRLENHQWIDFANDFDAGIAKLRQHIEWSLSPEGTLHYLRLRLDEAERDFGRTSEPSQKRRIRTEIDSLTKLIEDQTRSLSNPIGVAEQTRTNIKAGIERDRARFVASARGKMINPPPGIVPLYFQDRHRETSAIATFLQAPSSTILTITGRGGVGKTAIVCRVLKALETDQFPDDLGSFVLDGIIYLSEISSRRITVSNIFSDISKLFSGVLSSTVDEIYKNPNLTIENKVRRLVETVAEKRIAILLDNAEDVLDSQSGSFLDGELNEFLRAILKFFGHSIKILITTRVDPRELRLYQPTRQSLIVIEEGLGQDHSKKVLRSLDPDGYLGLQSANENVLDTLFTRTRGFPRALEAIAAILSADRQTTVDDLATTAFPPNVIEVLVSEAFHRLDIKSQHVLQALAIFGRPVSPSAVDFLLEPYVVGIDSAPILGRLASMHFVRREEGRFFLHPIDKDYAISTIVNQKVVRLDQQASSPSYTQTELFRRGADYFAKFRKGYWEEWETFEELQPQLDEFDLRCFAGDFDTALDLLITFDWPYLFDWGYYQLMLDLHRRLEGRITVSKIEQYGLNSIGLALGKLGNHQLAITYHLKSLTIAKSLDDAYSEGIWLSNLSSCYLELGNLDLASSYATQALAIAEQMRDRRWIASRESLLGNILIAQGNYEAAQTHLSRGLAVAREILDERYESLNLLGLASVYAQAGSLPVALKTYIETIALADEIKYSSVQHLSRHQLALVHLYSGQFVESYSSAVDALNFDLPENNHHVYLLLGILSLLNENHLEAETEFRKAIQYSQELVDLSISNYGAWSCIAISRAGLAICQSNQGRQLLDLDKVSEAFARIAHLTGGIGTRQRIVRLYHTMRKADKHGSLDSVEPFPED